MWYLTLLDRCFQTLLGDNLVVVEQEVLVVYGVENILEVIGILEGKSIFKIQVGQEAGLVLNDSNFRVF